jgi:hypothetical protein
MRIFILSLWLGLCGAGYAATDAENRQNFIEAIGKAAEAFTLLEGADFKPSERERFVIGELLIAASNQADKVDEVFLENTRPGLHKAFRTFATGCGVYGFGVHGEKEGLKKDGSGMLMKWLAYWNPIKEEVGAKLNPPKDAKP